MFLFGSKKERVKNLIFSIVADMHDSKADMADVPKLNYKDAKKFALQRNKSTEPDWMHDDGISCDVLINKVTYSIMFTPRRGRPGTCMSISNTEESMRALREGLGLPPTV